MPYSHVRVDSSKQNRQEFEDGLEGAKRPPRAARASFEWVGSNAIARLWTLPDVCFFAPNQCLLRSEPNTPLTEQAIRAPTSATRQAIAWRGCFFPDPGGSSDCSEAWTSTGGTAHYFLLNHHCSTGNCTPGVSRMLGCSHSWIHRRNPFIEQL